MIKHKMLQQKGSEAQGHTPLFYSLFLKRDCGFYLALSSCNTQYDGEEKGRGELLLLYVAFCFLKKIICKIRDCKDKKGIAQIPDEVL